MVKDLGNHMKVSEFGGREGTQISSRASTRSSAFLNMQLLSMETTDAGTASTPCYCVLRIDGRSYTPLQLCWKDDDTVQNKCEERMSF